MHCLVRSFVLIHRSILPLNPCWVPLLHARSRFLPASCSSIHVHAILHGHILVHSHYTITLHHVHDHSFSTMLRISVTRHESDALTPILIRSRRRVHFWNQHFLHFFYIDKHSFSHTYIHVLLTPKVPRTWIQYFDHRSVIDRSWYQHWTDFSPRHRTSLSHFLNVNDKYLLLYFLRCIVHFIMYSYQIRPD